MKLKRLIIFATASCALAQTSVTSEARGWGKPVGSYSLGDPYVVIISNEIVIKVLPKD